MRAASWRKFKDNVFSFLHRAVSMGLEGYFSKYPLQNETVFKELFEEVSKINTNLGEIKGKITLSENKDGNSVKTIQEESCIFPSLYTPTLDSEKREYYKKEYGLLDYHIDFFNAVTSRLDFKGKTVLEIGGSNMPKQLVFGDLGAKKWVCIDTPWDNHLKKWSNHYNSIPLYNFNDVSLKQALEKDDYIIFKESAENIGEDFAGMFDICLSNCAFEHILNLQTVLDRCHSALKKGGQLYSAFGPIWSSDEGSHFWINNEFHFSKMHPIPGHGHLLLSYSEIYDLILSHFKNRENAEKWAYIVKNGRDQLNHYFYEDYEEIMKRTRFNSYSTRPYCTKKVDNQAMRELRSRYPNNERFDVYSIEICAVK